ncbi:sigma factor-like helix-turn-helix DNA-binding protein, partial [Streptosporangium sandarakinum]
EGVLRARHLPAADPDDEPLARALRLVGYTAPGGTSEQAVRVIATRVGLTGPVSSPDLLSRLRERGDRDLLSLLA